MKRINEIIDKYREYQKLYEELQQFYTKTEVSKEYEEEIINKIKKIIANYYISTYQFKTYIGSQLNDFRQSLMQNDMELYYGSIYYIVERSIYIINCIRNIPNQSLNLDEIENTMLQFKKKYLDPRNAHEKEDDFQDVDDEFYSDYELMESCYKKLMMMEDELLPIVVEQWKKYLTSPLNHDDNYKYVMHCFSSGMVNPNLMNKACCSLYTPTIENSMYGQSGLIYDIDVDSIDTMCTDDAGSWVIDKKLFIERDCPGRWQLT